MLTPSGEFREAKQPEACLSLFITEATKWGAIISAPAVCSLLLSNLERPSGHREPKHILEMPTENRCLTKWISAYAKHPDPTRSAFNSHSPGQIDIFSDYLGGSHWAFPLECELQDRRDCGLFTLESPVVGVRSIIFDWTLCHMYTSSKRKNSYFIKHFPHVFEWP